MKEFQIENVSELNKIVEYVIWALGEPQNESFAFVLGLHGDLGAGKTTFMQILAKTLGVKETVTSPTFVIMKKYETQHETFKHLVHIDAYRIEDIDEMRPLKFDEELAKKGSIIGIEWAEKIEELLPPHTIHMTFKIEDETRTISVTNGKKD